MIRKVVKFGNFFVEIYQNKKCIFRESNLVAYDLKTLKLLGARSFAETRIREKGNFLSTRFFENDKMINIESFLFYLKFLKSTGILAKDEKVVFVKLSKFLQEICKMEYPNAKFITHKKFYKDIMDTNAGFYVELEYHGTWVFQKTNSKIYKLEYGLLKIQKALNKYIYTNFNGILNTKKTLELLNIICKPDFTETAFELRTLGNGVPLVVTIYKTPELESFIETLRLKITKITGNQKVDGNNDFLKIIKGQ